MYTRVIRAVQGHAGCIQAQIADEAAHSRITLKSQAPVCVHVTKSRLMKDTIGLSCPSLVPDGLHLRGDNSGGRGHVYCGQSRPEGISTFTGFRRVGLTLRLS